MRPEAIDALQGVDLILHTGDIGAPEVLESLESIASVIAIKGNNDRENWSKQLPESRTVTLGKIKLFLIHNVKELDLDPAGVGFQVVISGHSHKPSVVRRNGVLFVNPGSAGPRRFKLPVAVGKLWVTGSTVQAEIIELLH
jgi:putative phosphoesterase